MEELIKSQYEVGEKIEKMAINTKKDSADRKRNQDYFTKRISSVSALFAQFELQDNELKTNHLDSLEDDDYFKDNYFEKIKKVYDGYTTTLDAGLRELMGNTVSTNPAAETNTNHISTQGTINNEVEILVNKQNRLINMINHYLSELKPNDHQLNSTAYFNVKRDLLQQKWEELANNDQKIWALTNEKNVNKYSSDVFFQVDTKIQNAIIAIQEQIDKLNRKETTSDKESSNFKLSRIELPVFNGNYLKWTSFKDLFCTVVHNTNMQKTQKMFYLMSHLSGEAKMLVQHLSITEANYEPAWSIIESRYNNMRLLVNSWLTRLLSQPSISNENFKDIRSLHDVTKECLSGLESLGIQTSGFSILLVHLLIKKLDRNTHSLFEQNIDDPKALPTVEALLEFLEWRSQALEALGKEKRTTQHDNQSKKITHSRSALLTTKDGIVCVICKQNHAIYNCRQFIQQNIKARNDIIKNNNLCFNCLKSGHSVQNCTSTYCKICNKRHHTLLHVDQPQKSNKTPIQQLVTMKNEVPSTSASALSVTTDNNKAIISAIGSHNNQTIHVLLSTALIFVHDKDGKDIPIRAVLDNGSQANFITKRALQKLGLQDKASSVQIRMLGSSVHPTTRRVNLFIKSRITPYTTNIETHVLPHIIDHQPVDELDLNKFQIPPNIQLADPNFNQPSKIDMLIGAEFFLELLSSGKINLGNNQPYLQNTVFGWIIGGRTEILTPNQQSRTCAIGTLEEISLQDTMEKFWRQEDNSTRETKLTQAEIECEKHFNANTQRNPTGQFVVRLPFSGTPSSLGQSKDMAVRRFFQLERKLQQNPAIKQQYTDIFREYEELGYLEEIQFPDTSKPHYFVPHHYVEKADSTTTKIRPVFDFSAKTPSNLSLNDLLLAGPTKQPELYTTLLRFRTPRYVFTADIKQMYLQVQMHPNDRVFQLIIWRSSPEEKLRCFQITRVAFGSTSSPYLAIEAVQTLAEEFKEKYPQGHKLLTQHTYIDDGMGGSDSISEALKMQNQVQTILKSGGFQLHKWCANHMSLLEKIPVEHRALQLNVDGIEEGDTCKTLGLIWYPAQDEFKIKINPPRHKRITRRTVLSEISSIFDPLGLVGPVTIKAKIFMQKLWNLKTTWDASLPPHLLDEWTKFRTDLGNLHDFRVPRHLFKKNVPVEVQIHTFADASEAAFGAAVYLRAIYKDKAVSTQLLCAKSKVAPLQKVTLPRLELCAAVLAAELTQRIKRDLCYTSNKSFLWTDSKIVLDWINSEPAKHNTYVSNRIATIQKITKRNQWRHVPSKMNPADIISRGICSEKFKKFSMWTYGPLFLYGPETTWPAEYKNEESAYERKAVKRALVTTVENSSFLEQINHRNSLNTLIRIVAYCLRFSKQTNFINRESSTLSTHELDYALIKILNIIQRETFKEELKQLAKNNIVSSNSNISSLAPFTDDMEILRVGGRLDSSTLNYNAKHPILLPYNHWFTKLVMESIHRTHLHAGPQTLLAITKQRYWPIKGKIIARNIVNKCVTCTKSKPQLLQQIMGNLPASRVQPARPFITSGVDFAGPVYTHYKVRGKIPQKTYIAVFCCFATKAIHLELVSDLTTNAFIGAIKRFIARRGNCKNIYCDNATNFVGAKNTLTDMKDAIYSEAAKHQITDFCSNKNITFNFIPPRAPHFGGLWEAGVKAAKGLMRKHIGDASLTYEELETVIVEIESILNSRPLTPLSDDPNDLAALTPGHFLIGEPLTTTIDSQAKEESRSLTKRWELVSKIKREFWKRWSSEYLSCLQQRHKWRKPTENLEIGKMVLIKEDNSPVLSWTLGRITRVIRGEDGFVRVADVKTSRGELRRPIHKLAPLPIETNDDQTSEDEKTKELQDAESVDEENTQHIPPPKKQRPSNGTGTFLTTLLATTFLAATTGSHAINIKPFTTPPGLLFERMGEVNLINTEWNLLIYYNLTTVWNEFNTISEGINQLTKLCDRMEDHYCQTTTEQFTLQLREMLNQNEHLRNQDVNKRNKRGALNIVGNIANSLFGVLDAEYAKNMETTIHYLRENDEHLNTLIKNQTSIVDNTLKLIRGTELEVEKHFKEVEYFINHTDQLVDKISEELRQQNLHQVFNQVSVRILLRLENLRNLQNSLLQTIIDSRHGKINPILLATQQLKDEIIRIKEHLPSNLRLPPTPNNLLELYSLITIESSVSSNLAIFRLRVPLVSYDQFELLHVVPVPWQQNRTIRMISTKMQYIVIDLHRDQYYPFSEQELSTCTISNSLQYMCKQHHQLLRNTPQTKSCELSALSHVGSIENCKITEVNEFIRWIQLFQPNHWLYVTFESILVNLICSSNNSQIQLEGTGIIEINEDCILKDEFTTIQPHKLYSSAFKTSFITSSATFKYNLTTADIKNQIHMSSYNSSLNKIEELRQQVHNLQEAERSTTTIHQENVHPYIMGYLVIIIIIPLFIFVAFMMYKHKKQPKSRTTSAPRPIERKNVPTLKIDEEDIND